MQRKRMTTVITSFFTLSTIALCVLFDFGATKNHQDWELIFKGRSKTEWKDAWHQEKFIRCRETLVSHLYWACEKDIYRITRRRSQKRNQEMEQKENFELLFYPYIPKKLAKTFLRSKRSYNTRSSSSITAECCRSSGCTWEEYAEYCPINKRYV
ncbi:probable insulin-like peptide 7 [Onthophagus taurus]|uniref:probable insulin-like peptide 7 n=1 Tax=Onthophagus taurus TaxID=166361 RepID=UPI000C20BE42|nr:probable insulin-like peptide 7 [Onthophagus taurus]